MTSEQLTVAVIGAAGKMGLRVSNNLEKSPYRVFYSESSPAGREVLEGLGRAVVDAQVAAQQADVVVLAVPDVVVLAVPDVVLGTVSEHLVPVMKDESVLLTLDPAAAYANLVASRPGVHVAVAHPCHPSIFLQRTTAEEWADTFGGIAAPQEVVAAIESDDARAKAVADEVIRTMYAPVVDVHWVTVRQLAVLEPTLVETIACMIGALLKEALEETIHTVGVPEPAAKAMLYGHTQVALANALKGSNPFSEACHIAMTYGRETVIKEDWKRIFDDSELDSVIARMLRIEAVKHPVG